MRKKIKEETDPLARQLDRQNTRPIIDHTLAPDAETTEEQVAAPGRFKNFWKD